MDRIQDREFAPKKRVLITAFCKEGWGPGDYDLRWNYIDQVGVLRAADPDTDWLVEMKDGRILIFHISDLHVLADEPKPQAEETKADALKIGDIVRCLDSFGGPKEIKGTRGIVRRCNNGIIEVDFEIVPGREKPYNHWGAMAAEEGKTWERASIELGDTVEVLSMPTDEDLVGEIEDDPKVAVGSTGIVTENNSDFIRVKFDHDRVWAFMPGQIKAVKLNNG